MEYLDIYDENGNYLGTEQRDIVHKKALWHKTVHCWLYDQSGNVFFQIRKDTGTLYTTASGHLKAGESISEGFAREIYEEIGVKIDASDAEMVGVIPFIMDKEMKDGSYFRDRAFSNIYVDLYEGNYADFSMDQDEVIGLVLVNAKEVLSLFQKESGSVRGIIIHLDHTQEERDINFAEFLVNPGETAMSKYGEILKKVISLTSK